MDAKTRVVAVVTADGSPPTDLTSPLTTGGFAVRSLRLDESAVPAEAVAVLLVVDADPVLIAGFTRRCRVDAPNPRPVVWLLAADDTAAAPTGFAAGADVCLVRPSDPDVLLGQLNVLLRHYAELTRVAAKGVDAVELSERLGKLFRQVDADAAFARRTLTTFRPQFGKPVVGIGFEVVHHPGFRAGVNTYGVLTVGRELRFALCAAGGLRAVSAAVLVEAVARFLLSAPAIAPRELLGEASRRVKELGLPEAAVLGAIVGTLDASDGRVTVATGGLPTPVHVPPTGPAEVWAGGGAFLGHSEAGYEEQAALLPPGGRLLFLSGNAAADKRPEVRAAASDHQPAALKEFVGQIAESVFSPADADDGYTLLAVERASTLALGAASHPDAG